jgi:hypothetical protein
VTFNANKYSLRYVHLPLTLIFAFLAFEFNWILILPRYIRGARSTLDYTYSYGGNVLTLVERSVGVLLFMKPEIDLFKIYRGQKARRDERGSSGYPRAPSLEA